jgi:hypothetical protein
MGKAACAQPLASKQPIQITERICKRQAGLAIEEIKNMGDDFRSGRAW